MLPGSMLDGMLNKCDPDCTEFDERTRFDPSSRGRVTSPSRGKANRVPLIVTSTCLMDGENGVVDMVEVPDAAGCSPIVVPPTIRVVVAVAALPNNGNVCPPTTTLEGSTTIVAPPGCVTVIVAEPGVIVVVPRTTAGGRLKAGIEVAEGRLEVGGEVAVSVLNCGAVSVGSLLGDIGATPDLLRFDEEGKSAVEVVLGILRLASEDCETWILLGLLVSFLGSVG
jgi:hypothetical protein